MKRFQEYLVESLEFEEDPPAIPTAEPVEDPARVDEDGRRHFFLENAYPYAKRIRAKTYYPEKYDLQVELVKFQNWVKDERQKVLLIFEGRDAAGKGSTIKRFMEYINPRGARVVALDKPTETERGQWYFQRYLRHLPGPGEIVFFDRSWYNRAGVERVMGFCTEPEYREFFRQVPQVERMLVRSGIRLLKFYFSVSQEEQRRRFDERRTNPLKRWKLSPMDVEAEKNWDEYTLAKEEMFRLTHTTAAPWTIVKSDDKMRARLNAMRYVLHLHPYPNRNPDLRVPDPLLVATADEIYPDLIEVP